MVPDVTDVLVSPSSVVTEFCDGFSCFSDWEFVELQSFYFSKKRAHSCAVTQEEMRFEEPQVKAPPAIEKKNDADHTIAKLTHHSKRSRGTSRETKFGVRKTERSCKDEAVLGRK